MLRISKLADYACVVMSTLAQHEEGLSAGDIALKTHLHVPTVRKLLKALSKSGVLLASRGSLGGYQLARPLQELTLLHIVEAIDGPIALTDCLHAEKSCGISAYCQNQKNWRSINRVVKDALAHMPLGQVS